MPPGFTRDKTLYVGIVPFCSEMRSDEEFAKDAVAEFFREKGVILDIRPGANPPDYEVPSSCGLIALEVTRAESLFLGETGFDNRRTVDESLCRVCDQLNDRFGMHIPDGVTLLLHLEGPFAEFGRVKRALTQRVETIVSQGLGASSADWAVILPGARVKILRHGKPGYKKISGIIGNRAPITDIQMHTDMLTCQRVAEKRSILDAIPWPGPRWLALINNYSLASLENFAASLSSLSFDHGFERVLLISPNGTVLCVPE